MASFAEQFVRSYARSVVERIAVTIDEQTAVTLLSFAGRHVQIPMGAIAMREDAFRELAKAVDQLLGVEP